MRRNALRRWLVRVRQGRAGLGGLFLLSAGETTVLPVPVEVVLIPMMQLARRQVWRMAASVTAGAVAGAIAGYVFALLFMQTLGDPMITLMGWQDEKAAFDRLFEQYGFVAIVLVGMLPPVPFQLAIVSAGATGYSFGLFVLASLIARGVRYFALAALIRVFGDSVAAFYRENRPLAIGLGALLIAAIWGLALLVERIVS